MFLRNKGSAGKTTTPKKEAIPSVIARDMHILGNIVNEGGMVDLDGTLDGNLRCETLIVRAGGVVTGEVVANSVQVYGRVNGLIKAKIVHLFAGCHIEGIVMHEQLTIEDGAYIDGKCKRTDKPAAPRGPLELGDELQEKPVKMLENIRLIR